MNPWIILAIGIVFGFGAGFLAIPLLDWRSERQLRKRRLARPIELDVIHIATARRRASGKARS